MPDTLVYPECVLPILRCQTRKDCRQTAAAAVSLLPHIRRKLEDGARSKIGLSAYLGPDLLNRYRDLLLSLIKHPS